MSDLQTNLVVIGGGPGGYTAAFRAADLIGGENVTLVESDPYLGGVCLNVGCIPSKALLHTAAILTEAKELEKHGVSFGKPEIDLDKLRAFKDSVVTRLNGGLSHLAKQRKIKVIQGYAKFTSDTSLHIEGKESLDLSFKQAIIAVGSRPVQLPFLPKDDRIIDSTGALTLPFIPKRMLILGGGIIGMEMACVYHGLGAQIDVVELMPSLLGGVDPEILKPFNKIIAGRYDNIMLETKVVRAEATEAGIEVYFEGKNAPEKPQVYDLVLSSVGRLPNGRLIDAEVAGVFVNERGFIPVDHQQRTNVAHIYAIGDVVGNPMLAHKAIIEGHLAGELAAGHNHSAEYTCIPSVAYTDPEVAWVGMSEQEAKEQGIDYGKGVFPWAASGRALGINRPEGLTKLIFDNATHTLLGGAVVGVGAGDIINQICLAVEMRCVAEDLIMTIPAHPTLSESVAQAAALYLGVSTDLYQPKK